ncbi:MAG: RluA family pseudouridine synthase [Lachnospiraceae bacterium]|nr:RluA family pseudouridine synthase [Lachnospiraceae bacterium]
MIQITVTGGEAGQRLDKLLSRYMRSAPKSFFYKMLRKKNITLNGKKAAGNEIVQSGDCLKLFLSDETYEKFGGIGIGCSPEEEPTETISGPSAAGRVPVLEPGVRPPELLYQDAHILLFNKPVGMLSQKASPGDVSLVEYLNAYLQSSGCMTADQMRLVRPAVCNRLDRNTSGIVVAGISLAGLQTMNRLLKERSIRKYYRCVVCGEMHGGGHLYGYLKKDEKTNTVTVVNRTPYGVRDGAADGGRPIETSYQVLACENGLSLLEVHLITGRSHQIRAHLASIGHPILGDPKYGNREANRKYRRSCNVTGQLLHAYRLEFPDIDGELSYLSGKKFCAPLPEVFARLPVCRNAIRSGTRRE